MRRSFILFALLLLISTACQPTPEGSLIVGKDQEQMIEKAQGDTVYFTDAPAARVD